MNILIVDHLPLHRTALEQRLLAMGVKDVTHASSCEEAAQYLQAPCQQLELIIVNLAIPPADCIGLLRVLSGPDHSPAVPVAVAGELEPAAVQAIQSLASLLECPLAGFIGNPLHDTGLAHIFENILVRQQSHSKIHLVARGQTFTADSVIAGIEQGQLKVFFQPIMTARGPTLAGLEATPRWHHPEWGLVEPASFVPLLEEANALHRLTDEVMRQTAQALQELSSHGIETCASIRLPLAPDVAQSHQAHLPAEFAKVAAQHNVPSRRISFEITEQAGMLGKRDMLETFAGLRLHGFGLILNHFGSGESSLASLDTLPLTAIKIDPRYTADIISNSMHRKLLKSMLDLGRQLDVKVVATGVEGRYQRQYLSGIGFQLLQGSFIGKPVSVKEIVRRHGRVSSEICQAC